MALLCVGPLAVWAHRHTTIPRILLTHHEAQVQGILHVHDTATPWSSPWVTDGIPKHWRSAHEVPSIVVDPVHLSETWWFGPQVPNGRVWFATSQGSQVTWKRLSFQDMAHAATLPLPVRLTAGWVRTLETGEGVIPTLRMEPAGAFLADMGTVTGMIGWAASMEPTPGTIVVTWELRQRGGRALRLVTLWQWQLSQGWQCQLVVLQPEPERSRIMTPMGRDTVLSLPGWARGGSD